MSTRDLIDAIAAGDAAEIQSAFESEMSSRIADRLDTMRQEVAKNMFSEGRKNKMAEEDDEECEDEDEDKKDMKEEADLEEAADVKKPNAVHPDALHVQHVGGGKYKVHAVGKNFASGIKTGEHLNDTELDDFREMGGKIKQVK